MASRSPTLVPGDVVGVSYDKDSMVEKEQGGVGDIEKRSKLRDPSPQQDSHVHQSYSDVKADKPSSPSSSYGRRFSGARANDHQTSDPFGDEDLDSESESSDPKVKYKTLAWWQASAIMIAETVSIGILSLPSVLSTLGLVPGAILIVGLGAISTYTGYVIGQFKRKYPWVHNMGDAGYVLFEPFGPRWAALGREFLGASQVIFLIFAMASHILTWTICLNTLTDGKVCTIVWSVIGLLIFWVLDLPRTMKRLSWLACCSFVSIFSAILVTMIAVGVQKPAPNTYQLTQKVAFAEAFSSVTTLIFAYTGHVGFFSFIAEMKKPADFTKALIVLQTFDISMYLVAAVVIYYFAGDSVASPALGSTGPILSKVAYGIAIPTILIAGVILGHVASKLIYVRLFRGTRHMADGRWLSKGSLAWAAIALVLWTIAWIIAESIPNFNTLLALISSLFGSWFTYGVSGIFWLFINRYAAWTNGWKKISLTVINWFLIAMGAAICGIGLYASGTELHNSSGGGSWTCSSSSASS